MRQASVYVFLLALLCATYTPFGEAGSGTTPHLEQVFIGRCWQYQTLSEQNKIEALKVDIDCQKLWEAFKEAFAFKHPCNVTEKSYDKFFKMIDTSKKLTNALFWSGAHELVVDFTFINDDYIILEDTFTGYLLNNLVWCGSENTTNGLNEQDCFKTTTTCNVMHPVWKLASSKFADRATGVSQTLLNASRPNRPAYANGSYFRGVEMPRLRVQKLIVYLASRVDIPIREHCATSESMKELRADAAKRNITVECIDQPKLVMTLYCLKFPKSPICKKQSRFTDYTDNNARHWKMLSIILSVLFLLAVFGNFLCWILFGKQRLSRPSSITTINTKSKSVEKNENSIWI